jgi:transaldolase / glucose-6-phosphate isomerase
MEPLLALLEHGQSFWLDNLTRDMVRGGELARRVERQGLRGVTSNPAIFHKAISGGRLYDEQIEGLARSGASVSGIYEQLVVTDVQEACDVLRPVWQSSDGVDGYVSLEVSPHLIHDAEGSIEEARRLWDAVDRPNVMIKIPGTAAGVPTIERLVFDGVNVNVTLLFSIGAYEAAHEAYVRALARRRDAGRPLGTVASVASFFLSRIDVLVDGLLSHRIDGRAARPEGPASLLGTAAIASAKLAYRSWEERTRRDDWLELAAHGARTQRLLWASTSTKNPLYDPVRYVEPLLGPDTVNTMPEVTIEAFEREGEIRPGSIRDGLDEAERTFERLRAAGIDLEAVCEQLVGEGADKFLQPYDRLMAGLAARRRGALAGRLAEARFSAAASQAGSDDLAAAVAEQRFGVRIEARDPSLWARDPGTREAVASRLGWVEAPERARDELYEILRFADEVRSGELDHVLLLGMGGSSLCPLVAASTFGRREGWPELLVLDDVDPAAIRSIEATIDPRRTLFLVASKSGTTVETLSLYRHFFRRVEESGDPRPGGRFVALTDPGSPLLREAHDRGFRRAFETPPDVGGRFSALTAFGLVPMALAGIDVAAVVESARDVAVDCGPEVPAAENAGIRLGLALAALGGTGRNKLTLVASPGLATLPLWVEQLVAESTGKQGHGIVPVAGEPIGEVESYGDDRVFAFFRLAGEAVPAQEALADAVEAAGRPAIRFELPGPEALGGEFYRWEHAVAVAGALLGVNPFDEPDVAASKRITREILERPADAADGGEEPSAAEEGIEAHFDATRPWAAALEGAAGPAELLRRFVDAVRPGEYVAVLAFLAASGERETRLADLRESIRSRTGAATSFGFGPRYLHSSGQLHKGGPAGARFLLLARDVSEDLAVPGETFGFAGLQRAQALGDERALTETGRPVLRLNLGWYVEDALDVLVSALR